MEIIKTPKVRMIYHLLANMQHANVPLFLLLSTIQVDVGYNPPRLITFPIQLPFQWTMS